MSDKQSSSGCQLIRHLGGCHCGAVKYEVWAPATLLVYYCNCSICMKKQNKHFIVPHSRFNLMQGSEALTTYTFNTHQAKHMFCKICGVQSFYQPRSNPDGYGVMPHCLEPGTVTKIIEQTFDGQNWEASMASELQKKDNSILNFSKE